MDQKKQPLLEKVCDFCALVMKLGKNGVHFSCLIIMANSVACNKEYVSFLAYVIILIMLALKMSEIVLRMN